jgi:predicted secreted hydrolase
MNNRKVWIVAVLLVLMTVAGAGWSASRPTATSVSSAVLLPVTSSGTFKRVIGPMPLSFPKDDGAHPDYQTEWWYYTGNVTAQDGRAFGYQLTFFRRALIGPDEKTERSSKWAADQVYLAHFALTDVQTGSYQAFERTERGAAGLAGAQVDPLYHVWLHDWQVRQTGPTSYQVIAAQDGIKIDLTLQDSKGPVLEGDQGYSQKGQNPGNASIYVSQTRLLTSGTVTIAGQSIPVQGTSWMDHEFGTSALGPGEVGWDWFSIQLDDDSELMAYTIRKSDGSLDAYSRGLIIGKDGSLRALGIQDFQIEVKKTWKSVHSGGVYPAEWVITVPSERLTLQVSPLLADQELNVSFVYWEGAVKIDGQRGDQPVSGKGYVELTGYAQSMEGKF